MGRVARQGLLDRQSYPDRMKVMDQVGAQRWAEFEGGAPDIRFGTPEKLPENASDIAKEFYAYYRTPRGYHPRYMGTRFTSLTTLMNFYPLAQIEAIASRPILFVYGEQAHSKYFSEDAFKAVAEPKEAFIVPNAGHVDLYDRMDLIPFDKLTAFFTSNLA